MDRTDLVRLRWRLTGAWLWPTFLLLTVVDAAVLHLLPPEGDSESAVGGWLIATTLMLLAVVTISPALGLLLRRARSDLPRFVAFNYAGTFAAVGVSVALVLAGVIHHHSIGVDNASMRQASVRAEAWIGSHAPAEFQQDTYSMDTIGIQEPQIYRTCATNLDQTHFYCVVVNLTRRSGPQVTYDGTESNQLLDEGVQ